MNAPRNLGLQLRQALIIVSLLLLVVVAIPLSGRQRLIPQTAQADEVSDDEPTLDPATIQKYADPLIIPPVMPPAGEVDGVTEYEIAIRQFEQQILPSGQYSTTTVWGYGNASDPLPGPGITSTFNSPAFTIEARKDQSVRVTWINDLVDEQGRFLPHLLPVDQTVHWANPPGPRDARTTEPTSYEGPVPLVTHLHGGHTGEKSDGYPEAWYLPDAANIPDGYFTQGSVYGTTKPAAPGTAVFEYPNDQLAATLWYHDHALGITRLNVYAGLAGFYLLRDDVEDGLNLPGPAPRLGDAPGTNYYEIPIAIQDRSFNSDGSLFYPNSREFFDAFQGPYIPDPDSDVAPIWNPEFFGNAMMVNGRTWPYLEVEPRLYRLRFLNGSNSRFLILKFDQEGLPFNQIGSDGGLLPGEPLLLDQLLMAPAERADVIVDFSDLEVGEEVVLLNLGPDEPFKGPAEAQDPADPATTGQVMQFRVVPLTDEGNTGEIPAVLPGIAKLDNAVRSRDVTLNEQVSALADIPIAANLGTINGGPLVWDDQISETPTLGDTETWRIVNLTEDAHPIHLHLVMFQVVSRQRFDLEAYREEYEEYLDEPDEEIPDLAEYTIGDPVGPESWEEGWKDTVIANPGEITEIVATFDLPGLYVWHCHILEHEDHEMMRPYRVLRPIYAPRLMR